MLWQEHLEKVGSMFWQGSWKERAASCGKGVGRRGQHDVAWELEGEGSMLWHGSWKERPACCGKGVVRRGQHAVAWE